MHELTEKIPIREFLEALDIDNIRIGATEASFSCPFPGHTYGDLHPSASMNVETKAWICHGCGCRGNAITFASSLLGTSQIEAALLLQQAYDPYRLDPDERGIVSEVRAIFETKDTKVMLEETILPERLVDKYAVDWLRAYYAYRCGEGFPACDYMFERGFTPEALTDWEFGYDGLTRRVVFPIRNVDGKLLGFKGRTTDKEQSPKYFILGDRQGQPVRFNYQRYSPSRVVFGLDRITLGTPFVLCEGELNAVILSQLGVDGVALGGSNFSNEQVNLIKGHTNEVTLFLDGDNAGRRATKDIIEKLKDYVSVWVVADHEGDPASLDADYTLELIADAQPWCAAIAA